jgi:hypothetical protein
MTICYNPTVQAVRADQIGDPCPMCEAHNWHVDELTGEPTCQTCGWTERTGEISVIELTGPVMPGLLALAMARYQPGEISDDDERRALDACRFQDIADDFAALTFTFIREPDAWLSQAVDAASLAAQAQRAANSQ